MRKYIEDPSEFCKYLCSLNDFKFEASYSRILNDILDNRELDINSPDKDLTLPVMTFIIWRCLFCFHRVITVSDKSDSSKTLIKKLLSSLPKSFMDSVGNLNKNAANEIIFYNHSKILFRNFDEIDNCAFCLDEAYIINIDNLLEVNDLLESIKRAISSNHRIIKIYNMEISNA